jgi:uncharacterized protein (DUF2267 family)
MARPGSIVFVYYTAQIEVLTMSENHLPVLEHTIQITNVWLKKLEEEHHLGNRHQAYSALRAVLHALRDRLTPEQAAHLGAQLPILVRRNLL